MKSFCTLVAILVLTNLYGCASVTGSRNQPVSVQSTCGAGRQVAGAACKLTNDKGEWHVNSTPGSVTIQKAYGDIAVECQKPGFGSGVRVYSSAANTSVWGNILVGGIIGYAIDAGGGSGFDYPQLMSVEICDGVPKPDLDQQAANMSLQQLPTATAFASNAGCSPAAEVALRTPWGAERYRFSCAKRAALHMECHMTYGGCKEIPPF